MPAAGWMTHGKAGLMTHGKGWVWVWGTYYRRAAWRRRSGGADAVCRQLDAALHLWRAGGQRALCRQDIQVEQVSGDHQHLPHSADRGGPSHTTSPNSYPLTFPTYPSCSLSFPILSLPLPTHFFRTLFPLRTYMHFLPPRLPIHFPLLLTFPAHFPLVSFSLLAHFPFLPIMTFTQPNTPHPYHFHRIPTVRRSRLQ